MVATAADYAAILSRFDKCKRLGSPSRHGLPQWIACCPVHGDRHPSLVLRLTPRGSLVAFCLSNRGCTPRAIAAAVGTRLADWLPPRDPNEARRMTARREVATYDYRDAAGNLTCQVVRYEPKDFRVRRLVNGSWIWDADGIEPVPYHLPEILKPMTRAVIVVEGERKADAIAKLGLVATCNQGGAGKWKHDFGKYFVGKRVAILPDNDGPGILHAANVAGSLMVHRAESVRIVQLSGLGPKGDVIDWLAAFAPGTSDDAKRIALCQEIRETPEWRATVRA